MITYNNVNVTGSRPSYIIDWFRTDMFQYVVKLSEQFPKQLRDEDNVESLKIKLRIPSENELEDWLSLSEDAFSFWDNPLDADYDNL